MGDGDRVIGYVRVSTDEQGSSGAGLEAQREAIAAEYERRGWTLVRVEEDIVSGKTPPKRRFGLQRALDACRTGEAAGIIVPTATRRRAVASAGVRPRFALS